MTTTFDLGRRKTASLLQALQSLSLRPPGSIKWERGTIAKRTRYNWIMSPPERIIQWTIWLIIVAAAVGSIGLANQQHTYHVHCDFADFHISALLAEGLDALLLLRDLLGHHRPQIRAGASVWVGRDCVQFLEEREGEKGQIIRREVCTWSDSSKERTVKTGAYDVGLLWSLWSMAQSDDCVYRRTTLNMKTRPSVINCGPRNRFQTSVAVIIHLIGIDSTLDLFDMSSL